MSARPASAISLLRLVRCERQTSLTANASYWHAQPMGIHATPMLAPGCSPWRPQSEPKASSPDAVTDGGGGAEKRRASNRLMARPWSKESFRPAPRMTGDSVGRQAGAFPARDRRSRVMSDCGASGTRAKVLGPEGRPQTLKGSAEDRPKKSAASTHSGPCGQRSGPCRPWIWPVCVRPSGALHRAGTREYPAPLVAGVGAVTVIFTLSGGWRQPRHEVDWYPTASGGIWARWRDSRRLCAGWR
jgi:hypothetical protein